MIVIGLTGGIGTGKSQVTRILEELGAVVINADLLGHEAYSPGTQTWHEVVAAFGEGIVSPTGVINRQKLGAHVFSNPEALKQLNAIMHPRLYQLIGARIEELRQQGRGPVVVEAALLIEANWTPLVTEVWVTKAPEDQVVQRLLRRGNLDEAAIRARISSQMPQAERVKYADVVIRNCSSLEELRAYVQQLWKSRILGQEENN